MAAGRSPVARVCRRPKFGYGHPVAERVECRVCQDDIALLGQVFGLGKLIDQPPGEHVDQLDSGIPDDEASRIADGHGDLDGQHDLGAGRCANGSHRRHGVLDRQTTCRGASTVVAIEPARDRVAAKVDDLAAEPFDIVDDRVEHPVQMSGQFLRATLRAQLVRKRFGQWREPGDVGEQRRSRHPIVQLATFTERSPPIPSQIGVGPVDVRVAHHHRRRPMPIQLPPLETA